MPCAMVAEVMPKRSRPVMSSIFHASSVFGTLLAAAVGYFILADKPWGENTKTWFSDRGIARAVNALDSLKTARA